MDIRVTSALSAYNVYNAKGSAKKTERTSRADEKKDVFTLSVQAEDYQTVKKALAGIPDIRSDKVNQIKAKIEANTYNVSAEDVASKMLKNIGE